MRSGRLTESMSAQRKNLRDAELLEELASNAFDLAEKHDDVKTGGACEDIRSKTQIAILAHAKVKPTLGNLTDEIRGKVGAQVGSVSAKCSL